MKVSVMIQNRDNFGRETAVANLHQFEAVQGCSQAMDPSTADLLLDLSVILDILDWAYWEREWFKGWWHDSGSLQCIPCLLQMIHQGYGCHNFALQLCQAVLPRSRCFS